MYGSGDQPLILLDGVQGDEGDQDGHGLDVLLVLGIVAVILVLADLQAASTGEHNEDDADVTNGDDQPLPAGDRADAGDQYAGPEDHLT